jgi:SAM-dependent methyltransferase
MIRPAKDLPWVRGDAEHLPFAPASVDAAYATWAYFFTTDGSDPSPGLMELHRVVKPSGPLLIVDNLGDDEFSAYVEDGESQSADIEAWRGFGFDCLAVETVFTFDDLDEARTLLGFFFGESGRRDAMLEVGFRVALFIGMSNGPPPS